MSELKLVKKSIKVSYEGKDYLVAKPSNRQINDFSKNAEKNIEATISFLEMLGLPSEVGWEIDPESLTEIIGELIPKIAEKKS